ncbi:NADPH-dependent FMN reductase [Aestuariimicrobium ganziense]|uniref:NADPH-dependent FMN reductase n=1 Tax=Aestuariimicrobium ganziense TaxID=2773677 RepID=UPI0019439486|nr:NAD(P)H-dependent oxidoreductase [Aestuariimicrobium ganziense]
MARFGSVGSLPTGPGTRPVRNGAAIAEQVVPHLAEGSGAIVKVVDLRELALPLLDEPKLPAMGDYQRDHTRAWSEIVNASDAMVWLTPEYNGGFTAAAKNAIDSLFAEWAAKPTAVVGYGFGGGRRSAPMLATILGNVKADLVGEPVLMPYADHAPGENGLVADPAAMIAPYADDLRTAGRALADRITQRAEQQPAA